MRRPGSARQHRGQSSQVDQLGLGLAFALAPTLTTRQGGEGRPSRGAPVVKSRKGEPPCGLLGLDGLVHGVPMPCHGFGVGDRGRGNQPRTRSLPGFLPSPYALLRIDKPTPRPSGGAASRPPRLARAKAWDHPVTRTGAASPGKASDLGRCAPGAPVHQYASTGPRGPEERPARPREGSARGSRLLRLERSQAQPGRSCGCLPSKKVPGTRIMRLSVTSPPRPVTPGKPRRGVSEAT